MPLPRPSRPAVRLLPLLCCVLLARTAASTAYYVDAMNGQDVLAQDGLSPATAWKTLTYARSRIRPPGPHEIHVAAGVYATSATEHFPVTLDFDMSLMGDGPGSTIFRDANTGSGGTIRWQARQGQVAGAAPVISGFSVERASFGGTFVGAGVQLYAEDVAATSPVLTNVVVTGADHGLDIYASSYTDATTLSPTVTSCNFSGNGLGVLATSETLAGQNTDVSPTFRNCVAMDNVGDGMVFETTADWALTGRLTRATASPVITNCTIADNVGSGIALDNTNGDVAYKSGPIRPTVTNSILSGNGDYALEEYTSTTDPLAFDRNLIGGGLALYFDEGTTEITTLGAMPMGTGNQDAEAAFVRGLVPDWHIRADSPGVDDVGVGFPATDLEGDARPQDGDGDSIASGDIGADETFGCAVTAVIDPAVPPERCGLEPPLDLSAAASAPTAGWTCTQPLTYDWFADGAPAGTGPTLSVLPSQTTRYAVTVSCPDFPECRDTATVDVIVHAVPSADASAGAGPGGAYDACMPWDATSLDVPLEGTASVNEAGTTLDTIDWFATDGVFLGGTTLTPSLGVTNNGQNQSIGVTLTVTDSHACTKSSVTTVNVWRGPHVLTGGPYQACQDLTASQTSIPLNGMVDLPLGSAPTAWRWTTDIGQFEDSGSQTSTLQNPRLKLSNFRFNRTANLTLDVTDDHGCSSDPAGVETMTQATLVWTPRANPNGPYQVPEAATSPTTIAISGTFDGPPGTTLSWTTDLGTFESTGLNAAAGADQVVDVPNTGSDQLGQLCLTATPLSGTCPSTECTAISVRVSPLQPPHDVGQTLHVDHVGGTAHLSWSNPPIDATHDQADLFDVWESPAPGPGGWTPRATLQDVARIPGGTHADDATLLDVAGPDLLFLKVVSQNTGGFSCADPAAELPDCPSLEDCANGTDDDGDFAIDCADAGCAGVPPCP